MAVNSRFIQVHPDALVEWVWDDQFYYADNYSVIRDIQNNVSSFAFSDNATDPDNYNKIPQQLYLIDSLINKYGIADPAVKAFLQESQFVNNQPSKFDIIKIWFPIHYTFPSTAGFFLKTYGLNYENAVSYNFSNYFLDITIPGELAKIVNEPQPFRHNQRLWGKSLTIYVPSLYTESRLRTNNAPTLGTVNYNLTNGALGLSQTSPIFIDFRFLTSKEIVLGETTYRTTPAQPVSIPQAPEYNNLGVSIVEATDGDYFKINGIYNGSAGEFETFMAALDQSGKKSYLLYSITTYEENIPQQTRDIYVYQDFLTGIDDYRPVLKFSNTTASIRVDMKLVSAADGSIITKSAEYALTGNAVAKYGKFATPINISGAIKPKLYNSKPDQIALPPMELLNSHLKRKNNSKPEVRYIPYPVLTNVFNIIAQDASKKTNSGTYFGFGDLELVLSPFDNVVKLKIAQQVNANGVMPFSLPSSNSVIQLVFKSATSILRVPLYLESNEVDLNSGVVVFKISAADSAQLKKIHQTSKNFYLTITTNGIETMIYDGVFSLLDESPRVSNGVTSVSTKPKLSTQAPVNIANQVSLPGNFTPKPVTTVGNMIKQITNNTLTATQLKKIR